MGSQQQERYLIIGAGVFGVSTAIHLKQSKPHAIITLLDRTPFPNPSAASHDVNKIVRADYADIFYMKLALEAIDFWRHDPLYSPFFHQTGMAFIETIQMGRNTVKNYKSLGAVDVKAEMLPLEEARRMWGGVFEHANWEGAKECFWNPGSGWGEAEGALRAATQAAIDSGVIYHEATISALKIDEETSACSGAFTEDGEFLGADYVILCTGALTAKLLADSAPMNEKLQVGGRLVAAGAVSCTAKLVPELREKFEKAPVFFNGMAHTHGESVPLTPSPTSLLKFNHETSFTHLTHHPLSNQTISVPPIPVAQSTWNPGHSVPLGLRREVENVVWNTYGDGYKEEGKIVVDNYRMCWDALTPTQDFIISPHPHSPSLYLATGGSFHGWKFLPVIGKYVVAMLDGSLSLEARERWGWDRYGSPQTTQDGQGVKGDGKGEGACIHYVPRRDLTDVKGWEEMCKAQGRDQGGDVNIRGGDVKTEEETQKGYGYGYGCQVS